jgi:hypothetical protein
MIQFGLQIKSVGRDLSGQTDFIRERRVISQLCLGIIKGPVRKNVLPDFIHIALVVNGLNFFFAGVGVVGKTTTLFNQCVSHIE